MVKQSKQVRNNSVAIPKWKLLIRREYQLYLFCMPALIYLLVFHFLPMYGVQIAFKDFYAVKGIAGSPWAGLKHFERFISSFHFNQLIINTISLNIYSLVVGFPFPIILALLLHYQKNIMFKKTVQTVSYAPYFISVVVLCGMVSVFLSQNGIVNAIISRMGTEKINFMAKPELFRHIYVWSGIWQVTGFSAIIYMAVLSSIDPTMYEAAKIDGATKLKTMWYVDLPFLMPTIVILFILNMGQIMNVGFQKAFLLQTSANLTTSEVISTYIYKVGLINSQFSFSTAVDLFNTAINIILLLTANAIAKRINETSLF